VGFFVRDISRRRSLACQDLVQVAFCVPRGITEPSLQETEQCFAVSPCRV
jgi:hypothetical protein